MISMGLPAFGPVILTFLGSVGSLGGCSSDVG